MSAPDYGPNDSKKILLAPMGASTRVQSFSHIWFGLSGARDWLERMAVNRRSIFAGRMTPSFGDAIDSYLVAASIALASARPAIRD